MKMLKKMTMGIGFACALLAGSAHASVTIGGTRVVYPLEQREVTVKLDNDSNNPSLVQVWMDDGDANAKPGDIKVPFVITPPIFRMDPKKAQTLRVMYSGDAVPQDRESVYWLHRLDDGVWTCRFVPLRKDFRGLTDVHGRAPVRECPTVRRAFFVHVSRTARVR